MKESKGRRTGRKRAHEGDGGSEKLREREKR